MLQAPLDLQAPAQSMWSTSGAHGHPTVQHRNVFGVNVDSVLAPALRAEASVAVAGLGLVLD